jgi:DMSO/TMAO reductase YedYZ molybdopterin-dependent catalytic subunit
VRTPVSWNWEEFRKLPSQTFAVDISCVTKWTKLDTRWRGVSIDTLLETVEVEPMGRFVMAFSDDGYTTNIPLAEMEQTVRAR